LRFGQPLGTPFVEKGEKGASVAEEEKGFVFRKEKGGKRRLTYINIRARGRNKNVGCGQKKETVVKPLQWRKKRKKSVRCML